MDCGPTMQVSCLKRKSNMVAGVQGETPEVIGRYLNILFDTYSDTTNVEYVLLCIQLAKIIANRIGVPHLVARGPCAWPRAWEGPRTFYIIYTKQDKTTLEVRELYLRTSYVAFQDLLYNMYSCHTATGFVSTRPRDQVQNCETLRYKSWVNFLRQN